MRYLRELGFAAMLALGSGCVDERPLAVVEARYEQEHKKPVITCFGPFGGYKRNPTQDIADYLRQEGYKTFVLDVDYEDSAQQLENIIKEEKPDTVISFGVSPFPEYLNVSIKAKNVMSAKIPDSSGDIYDGKPIDDNVDETRSLEDEDVKYIKDIFDDKGIKYVVETDAGTYVCNSLLYNGIKLAEKNDIRFYFIHVSDDIFSDKEKLKNLEKAVHALDK